jgi:3-dehydroquinate dehydratase
VNTIGHTSVAYCDRCPARARVRAALPAGELHFCNHHIREHRDRLQEAGATLVTLPGSPVPIAARSVPRDLAA